MGIKTLESSMSVVEAARIRVMNAAKNGTKLYMSFSAGKDSLCMSHIVLSLLKAGKIDPKQLTVIFIDEEAIYPSMEAMAHRWRKRFISAGVEFRWYCLPFRQVSVLSQLVNAESWITWEPGQEENWCRQPPPFAIMSDPILEYPGQMNYQGFTQIKLADGINLIGIRASESLQRLTLLSKMNSGKRDAKANRRIFPIYDWKDSDIWRYIKEYNLDFPEIYMDLYAAGVTKNNLRLCAFFGDCGTQGLRWIAETDPALWERVQRREPNAYLSLLYWDSEMFARSTRKRKQDEQDERAARPKDYKAEVYKRLYTDADQYFISKAQKEVLRSYRRLCVKFDGVMDDFCYRQIYEALLYGDPKRRRLRAIYTNAATRGINRALSQEKARREAF